MLVRLVFEDWRKIGTADSVYQTEGGVRLSAGLLHSGTTFDASLKLVNHPAQEREIAEAFEDGFYPVFRVIPKE